jgi:hypothetical protein
MPVGKHTSDRRVKGITPQQISEMVDLSSQGMTLAEIGRSYGIAGQTVHYHVSRAKAKDQPSVATVLAQQVDLTKLEINETDSLRVTILKHLTLKGEIATARDLMAILAGQDRWRHEGLHSVQHVLHAMAKQGFITLKESKNGTNQKQLERLRITFKGTDLLADLIKNNGAGYTPPLEATDQHYQAKPPKVEPINQEVEEADDQVWGDAPPRDPLDAAIRAEDPFFRGDHAVAVMPDGSVSDPLADGPPVYVPPQTPAQAALGIEVAVPGRPYPILAELKKRSQAAAEAQARADKYMEAAILLETIDPSQSGTLQALAEDAVRATTLSPIEAEYLAFASQIMTWEAKS